MEFTFSQLKQKEVVNINDGKNLGKVCDLTFTYPENNVLGFTVTGSKGFKLTKQDQFIPIKNVVKIGSDTVLVKTGGKHEDKDNCPPPRPPKPPHACPPPCPPDRRSYDEYE